MSEKIIINISDSESIKVKTAINEVTGNKALMIKFEYESVKLTMGFRYEIINNLSNLVPKSIIIATKPRKLVLKYDDIRDLTRLIIESTELFDNIDQLVADICCFTRSGREVKSTAKSHKDMLLDIYDKEFFIVQRILCSLKTIIG